MTKMEISNLELQSSPNKEKVIKITAKSKGKKFTFAAKYADYMDEDKRDNLHKLFLESIKTQLAEEKVTKAFSKKELGAFKGVIVDDDEDE